MVMICQVSKLNRTSTLHFDYFKGKDISSMKRCSQCNSSIGTIFVSDVVYQKKKLEQSRAKLTG